VKSVIYKIEINGLDRFYIGSSVDFSKRRTHHLNMLRRGSHMNIHLQRVYDKYGEESFSFVILEECEQDLILSREQYWIDKYDFDNLINICPTAGENNPMYGMKGELSPNWGKKHSEETKKKISDSNKGKECYWKGKERPNHSERMKGENNPFYGKKHSEESLNKIREAARTRKSKNYKINLDIAREIRYRYINEKITVTKLAKEYGLSRKYCGELIRGKYWREND
jgi:group I intron endonuclease